MFKSSSGLKYYLYVSISKLEMLFQQIASSEKKKKSLEWEAAIGFAKIKYKGGKETELDMNDKLRIVVQALNDENLVGTIEEPGDYVKGTLPMKWGLYRDWGRPAEEPPLVYFGGRTENTIFGFGGSSRHIIGNVGASSTGSRSVTPYLVAHLLAGLGAPLEGWRADRKEQGADDRDTFEAIKLASDHLKGPDQPLEFYAKTLLQGEFRGIKDQRGTKVLLGSPLYVALASPYPADLSNY